MAGESTSYATSAIETSDALLSAGLILLPILAFPIILLLGHLLNGTDLWKRTLKEGGLIALPIMIASFAIAMVAILGHFQDGGMRHIFDWANFNLTGIEGEQSRIRHLSRPHQHHVALRGDLPVRADQHLQHRVHEHGSGE